MSGPPPVLVAGASGYLGRFVVEELLRRGVPVRALVRSADSPVAAALAAAGAYVVAADATKPGALVGVCDGCTAVVSCMAADMHFSSGTPESVDRDANIALFQEAAATATRAAIAGPPSPAAAGAAAAGAAAGGTDGGGGGGVRRFLLVATYEGREARASVPMHSAKEAAVDFVTALAPEHGISYCIVRPTAYFKDFTEYPWSAMQRHAWMVVPGGGRARYNPIDGAELAAFIADQLLAPGGCADQQVQIGGPQVLTFREVIYQAAEAAGRRRQDVWILPLPVLLLRALGLLLGALGALWPPAAAVASGLRFAAYSCSHDSVGQPYGQRTVADCYREKRREMLKTAAPQEAGGPPKKGD